MAIPTIAANSALWVRMSMLVAGSKSLQLIATAVLLCVSSVTHAQAQSEAETETETTPLPDEVSGDWVRISNPAFPSPEIHKVPIQRGLKIERKDLIPYFAEGKLAEAKNACGARRYGECLRLLDGAPKEPWTRYLKAWALKQGKTESAAVAKEFEAISTEWPGMKDRCLVLAGQTFETIRDWASAVRVYRKVNPGTRQQFDAAIGLSRALQNLGQGAQAKEVLLPFAEKSAPAWGRDVGAEALAALAAIAVSKKDTKGEVAALGKLWSRHPNSIVTRRMDFKRMGAPTNEMIVSRAEALIDSHRNHDGVELLNPKLSALKVPDPLGCRAQFAFGKAQRKLRQHAKAATILAAVVSKCRDNDLRARAQFLLAFSRTVIDLPNGARTYEALAREFPQHPFADDSLFLAADAYTRAGETKAAEALWNRVIAEYTDGDQAAEARFRIAWAKRTKKDWAAATEAFTDIEKRYTLDDDPFDVERARYWRARVLEAQGNTGEARDLLADVALRHPATYYGLTARERLRALDEKKSTEVEKNILTPVAIEDAFPLYAGPLSEEPHFLAAIEWLKMGASEQVPMELLAIDRSNLSRDAVRLLVLLISLSGEERSAHGLARLWLRRDLSGRMDARTRSLWQIAYPDTFRELVVKHAQGAELAEPDLLQALMREESALDPRALSWAGALGLTQLMPATAAEVASKLKLSRPSKSELLDPDLNLRLGAYYLSGLIKQFKGVKQYAVAAYNAGPNAVNRWRKERPQAELDEWVEEIPLAETRGYVKRVLRSFNTYRLLHETSQNAASAVTARP